MRTSLVLASLLALAGCASWFHARIPAASTPVPPTVCASIWSAALEELQARGFTIAASDRAGGTLRTQTIVIPGRVPCGHLECAYRDTVHVTVAPHGEVAVRIAREISGISVLATPGAVLVEDRWRPPDATQRSTVAGVLADQGVLLRAILQRAGAARPPEATSSVPTAPSAPAQAAADSTPVAGAVERAPETIPADGPAPQAPAPVVAPASPASPAPVSPGALPVSSEAAASMAASTRPAAEARAATPYRIGLGLHAGNGIGLGGAMVLLVADRLALELQAGAEDEPVRGRVVKYRGIGSMARMCFGDGTLGLHLAAGLSLTRATVDSLTLSRWAVFASAGPEWRWDSGVRFVLGLGADYSRAARVSDGVMWLENKGGIQPDLELGVRYMFN